MVTQHALSVSVRCQTNLRHTIQRPGPSLGEKISSSCLWLHACLPECGFPSQILKLPHGPAWNTDVYSLPSDNNHWGFWGNVKNVLLAGSPHHWLVHYPAAIILAVDFFPMCAYLCPIRDFKEVWNFIMQRMKFRSRTTKSCAAQGVKWHITDLRLQVWLSFKHKTPSEGS